MKKVEVTYYCDFCKQVVDTDSDTVRAILPGRIGYKGSFLADTDDQIRHYHDYCLEHILSIQYKDEKPEPEPEPEPEEVEEESVVEAEPKEKKKVDHGRIVALYTANRTPKWTIEEIADDVRCSPQTVRNHLIKEGIYAPTRGGNI